MRKTKLTTQELKIVEHIGSIKFLETQIKSVYDQKDRLQLEIDKLQISIDKMENDIDNEIKLYRNYKINEILK